MANLKGISLKKNNKKVEQRAHDNQVLSTLSREEIEKRVADNLDKISGILQDMPISVEDFIKAKAKSRTYVERLFRPYLKPTYNKVQEGNQTRIFSRLTHQLIILKERLHELQK